MKVTVIYQTDYNWTSQVYINIDPCLEIEDAIRQTLPDLKSISYVFEGWPTRIKTNGGIRK